MGGRNPGKLYQDATRNDEILASQKGYSADQNIETMACNYRGERMLKDESDGSLYDVKRTYKKDKMASRLYLRVRGGSAVGFEIQGINDLMKELSTRGY